MVVEKLRNGQAINRLCPIRKHHRNGAYYLHLRLKAAILLDTQRRVPGVRFDFAKELVATHHVGKALAMMLKVNKIAIAKLAGPVRKVFRYNMRMRVYLQHRWLVNKDRSNFLSA